MNFTGCMDSRGFRRGRVSVGLFRTPVGEGSPRRSTKEDIGYALHAQQKLNVGDQFHQTAGTIFIQHRPRCIPLTGVFEVEVTAVSSTEYSVAIVAGQCELGASLVDKKMEEAKILKVGFFS